MSAPVRRDVRPPSAERLESAAAEGRRLAARDVARVGAPGSNTDPVEALARQGIPRLREMGVITEIVRARHGCLVVRTAPRIDGYAAEACALVQAWLGALPAAVHGMAGTVAESSCGARGGRACMHTLMWQDPSGIGRLPLEPSGPDLQVPAPSQPAPSQPPLSQRSGGATPAPSTGAAIPNPIPIQAAHEMVPVAPPTPRLLVWPAPERATGAGQGSRDALPVLPRQLPERQAGDGEAPWSRDAARSAPPPGDHADRSDEPMSRSHQWAWVRRRAWLVVVGLLAGFLGGFAAAAHGATSYSATSVLVVQSSGPTAATSSANGAEELAVTYAALIPDDDAMLRRVAGKLGLPPASVGQSLAVESESGTALVQIKFSSADAATAVSGANDVATVLTSADPPGRAIAAGSVAAVSSATTASPSGGIHKYGLPLGVLGGLLVGAGAALVAERTDRRVDDLGALGGAAGCPATVYPGGLTTAEIARSLERSGSAPITVVPMRAEQRDAAHDIAWSVRETWPVHATVAASPVTDEERPEILVSPSFADAPQSASIGSGQTVLIVGAGERAAAVREVTERLRLLGRGPAWAILVWSGNGRRPDDRDR